MSTSAQAALLAAATMMLAQATSLANMRPVNFDPGPYMHPQRLIDIGRRRLNLYCSGSGSRRFSLMRVAGATCWIGASYSR